MSLASSMLMNFCPFQISSGIAEVSLREHEAFASFPGTDGPAFPAGLPNPGCPVKTMTFDIPDYE
jgi:hypothetical protein